MIFIYLLKQFGSRIDELEELLSRNRIWKQRLVDIGIVNYKDAISSSFSGVLLRGSGVSWDLRKNQPYEIYFWIRFWYTYRYKWWLLWSLFNKNKWNETKFKYFRTMY